MQADATSSQAVSCDLFDIQRTCSQATWREHGCSPALTAWRVFDRTPWPLVGVTGWHWGGDTFMLEDPVASSTWKLNCSESTRIMEFRVVNCHEAGLELLWCDPYIALWLNSILKGSMKFGIMVWMSVWKELLVKGSVETTVSSFEHSLHGWIYCWGELKLIKLQGTNMRSVCLPVQYTCIVLSDVSYWATVQSVQNKAGSSRSLAKAWAKQILLGRLVVQDKNIQSLTNEKCFLIVTLCQIF